MISLRVDNLSKKFNRHVVFEGLSFEHSEGILGISGSNGSGKSTLMKSLAYLLRPTSGSMAWEEDGEALDQGLVKARMGYAAPYINLYAELTARENLTFLMEASGGKADDHHLNQLLETVQIPHLGGQLFGSLSTGQQQRVKLAAALVRNPRILMLDEPGSNLDAKGHFLVSHMVQTAKESGALVILASNDPQEIELCDTVIELHTNS